MVSRGEDFVFGLDLGEVAAFLGLEADGGPALTPAELVAKLDLVLAAMQRFVCQIPDDKLAMTLPKITRTYRELCHHIARIPEAFLECVAGAELSYEALTEPPPEAMRTGAEIAAYGGAVRRRVARWVETAGDDAWQAEVATYYGPQTLQAALERTTWHSAQHVRQLMMVLSGLGIAPDRPLVDADLAGLPLPEKVWDD